MNSFSLDSMPVVFADIIVEPSPPPPRNAPDSFLREGSFWPTFWAMAVIAAGLLWWLRSRREGDATKGA